MGYGMKIIFIFRNVEFIPILQVKRKQMEICLLIGAIPSNLPALCAFSRLVQKSNRISFKELIQKKS